MPNDRRASCLCARTRLPGGLYRLLTCLMRAEKPQSRTSSELPGSAWNRLFFDYALSVAGNARKIKFLARGNVAHGDKTPSAIPASPAGLAKMLAKPGSFHNLGRSELTERG